MPASICQQFPRQVDKKTFYPCREFFIPAENVLSLIAGTEIYTTHQMSRQPQLLSVTTPLTLVLPHKLTSTFCSPMHNHFKSLTHLF